MKRRLLLTLLLLATQCPVAAQPLRVGIEDGSPPKWLHHSDGTPDGFCAQLLEQLSARSPALRFQFPQPALPQKRMEAELQNGNFDLVCGLTRTPQRSAHFLYLEPPVYAMDYVLFARADDRVAPRSWDDVRALGEHGGILLNYDSSAIRRLNTLGGLRLDPTGRTVEQNLRKLQSGKGRFFFYIRHGGEAEIRRLKLEREIRVVEPALDHQDFFLLLGRHVVPEQRDALQEALRAFAASGQLQALQKQWSMQ